MKTITTAELRRKTGQVLKQLNDEGQIYITNQGEVVALLIPLSSDVVKAGPATTQKQKSPKPEHVAKPKAPPPEKEALLSLKELNEKINAVKPKQAQRQAPLPRRRLPDKPTRKIARRPASPARAQPSQGRPQHPRT